MLVVDFIDDVIRVNQETGLLFFFYSEGS